MPELLLEIGCEEIPAEDLFVLQQELPSRAQDAFESNRLPLQEVECQVTPRRLVLKAHLDERQQDVQELRMGPPRKVAIDAGGSPTPAGLGFAKNAGLTFEQLKIVDTPKGEYMAAEVHLIGRSAKEIILETLPPLISKLPFRKFMRWGSVDFVFGRPIRNLLLLLDGEVIPMTLADVTSGNTTFGHRFLGKTRIQVRSYKDFKTKLRKNYVLLSFQERVQKISAELLENAEKIGAFLKEDQELLSIMANEVEFPEVLSGSFSEEFLSLPQEILINAMRKHQKYFSVVRKDGSLLPVFLTVLNTHTDHPNSIREGHERVLRARLRDASFFYQEDQKKKLAERVGTLSRITYIEKLGSYAEKMERMKKIGHAVVDQLGISERASQLLEVQDLSKADLTTLMVGEFPELQGVMGGLYAKNEGYPEQVWRALYEQYLPVSSDDPVPQNLLGALLSLTDRVDTIVSGYVMNMVPTGSRDPYALRRVATGAVRIICEHNLNLNLQPIIDQTISLFTRKTKLSRQEMLHSIMEFIQGRLRFLMEQKGVAHDYLDAILNVETESLLAAKMKVEALWALRESKDLVTLARGFKRIHNIIFAQNVREFDPELMKEDGEKRLAQVFGDLEFRVEQLMNERQYSDALEIMVTLGPEIDNFFDEILVMTDNESLRTNRIALLRKISDLYRRLADFSALQIES